MQAVDLIAELVDSAERPLTFPASKLPHEAARRLLETMGVTIVEDVAPRVSSEIRRKAGPSKRRGDERPATELVQKAVEAALERARARGEESELERVVRAEWAA